MMAAEINPVYNPKMMKYAVEFMCLVFVVFSILSCHQAMAHRAVQAGQNMMSALCVATPATVLYWVLNHVTGFEADEDESH